MSTIKRMAGPAEDVRRQLATLGYKVDTEEELLVAARRAYGISVGQARHMLAGSQPCILVIDDQIQP